MANAAISIPSFFEHIWTQEIIYARILRKNKSAEEKVQATCVMRGKIKEMGDMSKGDEHMKGEKGAGCGRNVYPWGRVGVIS